MFMRHKAVALNYVTEDIYAKYSTILALMWGSLTNHLTSGYFMKVESHNNILAIYDERQKSGSGRRLTAQGFERWFSLID